MKMMEVLLNGQLRTVIQSALHRDVNGTSVLMAAVARGDNSMALWLLKKFGKALAILPNYANMLPLHVAAAQGNLEFLRVVVKFDSSMVNTRDEFGCTAVVYAVQAGCLSSVRYLVENAKSEMGSVSNRGQSLLHIACLCGHEHIARWLLNRMGSEAILWSTNDHANALHCAAFNGSVPCLQLLLGSFSRRKRRQVLSIRDGRGNSPLHLAAINNHLMAAQFMLENGAEANIVNGGGHSAQGIATLRNHTQMQQLLSQYNTSNGKKNKKSKVKTQMMASPVSGYSSSPSGLEQPFRASVSPRDLSSGYSSNADVGDESTVSIAPEVVERHRMRFIEDNTDSLIDVSAQTDEDLLNDGIKVLNDAEWAGLGLSAVEQIDRVLDELTIVSPPSEDYQIRDHYHTEQTKKTKKTDKSDTFLSL